MRPQASDVLVVGQGIVGLVAAWRAARAGLSVTTVDPDIGSGATHAAAGMLAPVTETEFGEDAVLALNLASAHAWPAFAADVEAGSGLDIAHARTGALHVAFDADDARELSRITGLQRSHGLAARTLTVAEARDAEPLLGPRVAAATWTGDDHQVDPRRLLLALRALVSGGGARHVCRGVESLIVAGDGRVVGARDDTGAEHRADLVVLAAGAATPSLVADLPDVVVPVRPVKGQVVRLDASRLTWLRGERVVRGIVQHRPVYVVGRADGEIVVGATSEERADPVATAGGVFALLRDARALLPGLDEAPVVELTARLRPATPDHLPLLGPTARPGLLLATGHHRHGVLQAAATAQALDALYAGRPLTPQWAAADPTRFTVKETV
ncbi:glycine oxidase ThiO [Aeromicrobium sp. CTD01-1L150]|uniref:glycine oxidase ThiO n=1 Tax=Aeromicrobium sp. CTD01-1L150 TaxID=3341830 RepID=UPI0035C1716B